MPTKLRKELINIELAIITGDWDKALDRYKKVNTNLDQLIQDLTPEETELVLNLIGYIESLLEEKLKFLRKSQSLLKATQNYIKY